MLVTVQSTGLSRRPVGDLLAWCQSGPSRAHWPGVQRIRWDDTTALPRLYYEVEVRAPGAPHGRANVEEHMCRPEEDDDGVFFESAQLWHWSSEEVGGAWATYRFTESQGYGHLRFNFRYLAPHLGGAGDFDRDEFSASIDEAVERYVQGLVTAGTAEPPPAPAVADTDAPSRRRWLRR